MAQEKKANYELIVKQDFRTDAEVKITFEAYPHQVHSITEKAVAEIKRLTQANFTKENK